MNTGIDKRHRQEDAYVAVGRLRLAAEISSVKSLGAARLELALNDD